MLLAARAPLHSLGIAVPLMPSVESAPLPAGALLEAYARANAYTHCYCIKLRRNVTLAEFMTAFYTTPVFRLERWLLAHMLGLRSTDQQAQELAQGKRSTFSAWHVEARDSNQALLAAGHTRSWLMVASLATESGEGTALFFGSAVVARQRGGFGWRFSALLGFHKLYSRVLLGGAGRRRSAARS
jgi:hypothetical protein